MKLQMKSNLIDDPLPILRAFGGMIAIVFALLTIIYPVRAKELSIFSAKNSDFNPKFSDYLVLETKKNSEKLAKQSEIQGRELVSVLAKTKEIGLNKPKNDDKPAFNQLFLLNKEENVVEENKMSIKRPDAVVFTVITAYTSTPGQTDDSPFIAASGKHVYDGMIAANWLPFGTKIKIPELYGDKIFTVDDRMNRRYGYGRMDIWLDTTVAEARKFGVKRVDIEIYYEDTEVKTLAAAPRG